MLHARSRKSDFRRQFRNFDILDRIRLENGDFRGFEEKAVPKLREGRTPGSRKAERRGRNAKNGQKRPNGRSVTRSRTRRVRGVHPREPGEGRQARPLGARKPAAEPG